MSVSIGLKEMFKKRLFPHYKDVLRHAYHVVAGLYIIFPSQFRVDVDTVYSRQSM